MKSIFFMFLLALSTSALADNIICAVFNSNNEKIARVKFDSESNEAYQDYYFEGKSRSISISKLNPGFIAFEAVTPYKKDGVTFYPKSSITLEESMIKKMEKGNSFGFSLNTNIDKKDHGVCYNMKDEDMAPFDNDYVEKLNSPVGESKESKTDCRLDASTATRVKLLPKTGLLLNESRSIPHPDTLRK